MIIIGIDYATDPNKTGLALGSFENEHVTIREFRVGSKSEPPDEIIINWLPKNHPALLALDAPLGWPVTLGKELPSHVAGELLRSEANDLFRRETDRVVKAKIGKQSLDVGADKIARTAHSALKLLHSLRDKTGLALPLTWEMGEIRETSVIEVYPAATLKVRNIDVPSYKDKERSDKRRELLNLLSNYVEIAPHRGALELDANKLDAVICVLGASDFLQGKCIPPVDEELARKEGWIWVQDPDLYI